MMKQEKFQRPITNVTGNATMTSCDDKNGGANSDGNGGGDEGGLAVVGGDEVDAER